MRMMRIVHDRGDDGENVHQTHNHITNSPSSTFNLYSLILTFPPNYPHQSILRNSPSLDTLTTITYHHHYNFIIEIKDGVLSLLWLYLKSLPVSIAFASVSPRVSRHITARSIYLQIIVTMR